MAQDLTIAKQADHNRQHTAPNVLGSQGVLPDGSGWVNKPADGGAAIAVPHQTNLSIKVRS